MSVRGQAARIIRLLLSREVRDEIERPGMCQLELHIKDGAEPRVKVTRLFGATT